MPTVEIWSDIMCPFCWLGKRHFDRALQESGHVGQFDVVLKSFQLNPGLSRSATMRSDEYLAETKGMDQRVARQLNDRVARMGADEGLRYDFDRVMVVNTFDAHRLLHVAQKYGRQPAMADRLFRAHFEQGRNVADLVTLVELAVDAGLDRDVTTLALESEAYADDVRADIAEADELGIHGVPFFVFDRKFAVSGAQESSVFQQALDEVGVTAR